MLSYYSILSAEISWAVLVYLLQGNSYYKIEKQNGLFLYFFLIQ